MVQKGTDLWIDKRHCNCGRQHITDTKRSTGQINKERKKEEEEEKKKKKKKKKKKRAR